MANKSARQRRPKAEGRHAPAGPGRAPDAPQRADPGPANVAGRADNILFLQRTLGNRAVGDLLQARRGPGQPAPLQRQPETPADSVPFPGHNLSIGFSGDAVRSLQQLLNRHGAGLDEDGQFGPLTHQAVLGFQQNNGLAVDGIVGPLTWEALNSGGATTNEEQQGEATVEVTETAEETGGPIAETDAGLTPADLAVIASALTAAAAAMAAEQPVAAGAAILAVQAAANELTAGQAEPSSATPEAAPQPAAPTLSRLVMRKMPKPLPPAGPDPLAGLKQSFRNLTDFMVFNLGEKPYSGPQGQPGDPVLSQALSCDYLHRLLAPILDLEWPASPGPTAQAAHVELEQFVRRLVAMRAFYNSLLPQAQFLPGGGQDAADAALPAQNRPTDQRRIQIAATGLGDLGKVKAHEQEADGRRVGWRHLIEMFDKAWPTHEADQVQDFKIEQKHQVQIGVHGSPGETKLGDWMPSWCGVGATYWAKQAHPGFPDWKQGVGVTNQLARRDKRQLPQLGDLVVSVNQGHHGIITWVDPAAQPPKSDGEWSQIRIQTVESNIGGEIVETPSHHATLAYWTVGVFDPFTPK
jgi:hypothetical protein